MTTHWRSGLATVMTLALLPCAAAEGAAPAPPDELAQVLALDRQFWDAYNACDTAVQRQFFRDDVEFYHDKGGPTFGADALIDASRANLCAGSTRVRRELIDGTLQAFPLRRDGVLYGAILAGDHRFYVRGTDRPETLDGVAKFTHLWLLDAGAWRMARVLSYDHGPAPYVSSRKAVALSDAALDVFVGRYRTSQGIGTVRRENGTLVLSFAEGSPFTLHPAGDAVFFTQERDLTFEFARRPSDGALIMRVREKGAVVDEGVVEP